MAYSMSYGELFALRQLFDEEREQKRVIFDSFDTFCGAWVDYCAQYEENPNGAPEIDTNTAGVVSGVKISAFGQLVPVDELQSLINDGATLEELTPEYLETCAKLDTVTA